MNQSKEEKELFDKCKDRLNTPKEEWMKYEGPEQLKNLIMEDKKKRGWKFKGEK
ncbi:hypothetical protein [Bacillus sp. EB01]|uniref:hypothetical protein n=1 Tax=Bacillus sp. EB01 TaxID=1347086 RepID=UPI000ABE363C|nr:hypothetical protein [Bacillus sp. EB01]